MKKAIIEAKIKLVAGETNVDPELVKWQRRAFGGQTSESDDMYLFHFY
jgi:hypothetical protein